MKKIILIITLLLIVNPAFAQTAEDLMTRFQSVGQVLPDTPIIK